MRKSDKPVVLFTAEDGFNEMGDDHFVACHSYAWAIRQGGGIPLTPLDIRLVEEYASYGDALVLTDGPRIHMARLGGICRGALVPEGFSRTRDDLECALAEAFLAKGKPVLGIGRGLDVLQSVQGTRLRNCEFHGSGIGGELKADEIESILSFVESLPGRRGSTSLSPILVEGGPAFDRFSKTESTVIAKTYCRALAANGSLPLLATEAVEAPDYEGVVLGLVLSGSQCYSPTPDRFTELCQREADRQSFAHALFSSFVAAKKPILGICLGLQRINLFLGGSLKPGFKFEEGVEHMFSKHSVDALEGSILHSLFGPRMRVNSRHNVRIDHLAQGLIATAYSPDGVIEAAEHLFLPIHALQFHPERMRGEVPEPPDGVIMDPLFRQFSAECLQVSLVDSLQESA